MPVVSETRPSELLLAVLLLLLPGLLVFVEGLPQARGMEANHDTSTLLQRPSTENLTGRPEVLKALFSTRTSKDVGDLPNRNKFVLGITSLWMIFPVAQGVIQWCETGIAVSQKFVIVALACCCLSSTLFWFDATRGSVLHKLDKLCAVQFVVVVGFVTAFPGSSGRALTTGVGVFLPCAMVVLFLLGDLCFKRNMYELQLWFHLLFRYVGYWWGHLLLVPAEKNFASAFVSMSIGYFGHIVYFNELARRKTLLMTEDLYWSSCAVLTLWIFICGQVHLLVSYGADARRELTSIRESVVWLSYAAGLLAAVISALQQPAVDGSRALHAYSEEIVADKDNGHERSHHCRRGCGVEN